MSANEKHTSANMISLKVVFPLGMMERYGTGTLIGALIPPNVALSDVEHVEIVFQETSMEWKRQNGGPHLSLATEHFPFCFLEDVLYLQHKGIKVTCGRETVDPPK